MRMVWSVGVAAVSTACEQMLLKQYTSWMAMLSQPNEEHMTAVHILKNKLRVCAAKQKETEPNSNHSIAVATFIWAPLFLVWHFVVRIYFDYCNHNAGDNFQWANYQKILFGHLNNGERRRNTHKTKQNKTKT